MTDNNIKPLPPKEISIKQINKTTTTTSKHTHTKTNR